MRIQAGVAVICGLVLALQSADSKAAGKAGADACSFLGRDRISTLLGLNIAYLVGSTVVVEQVFALNGLGSLLLDSIINRDFPVVQAVTLVLATSVVLINLATDLAAARLDPRIRLQ